MGKVDRRSCKKYRVCPECGSIFVDWNPYSKRWHCLVRNCRWMEEEKSHPGCYNYATGSCWYGYKGGHIPWSKQISKER